MDEMTTQGPNDLRTPIIVVAGVVAWLIALATFLRKRKRRVDWNFVVFTFIIGAWYLAQYGTIDPRALSWARFLRGACQVLAVTLPPLALLLFGEMMPHDKPRGDWLFRGAVVLTVGMGSLAIALPTSEVVGALVFVYVFGFLGLGLYFLNRRGQASPSLATRARVRFLVVMAVAAAGGTALDMIGYLPHFATPHVLPVGVVRVGAVTLSMVTLLALSEALRYERLLDMSEFVGRLFVWVAQIVAILIAFLLLHILLKSTTESVLYAEGLLAVAVVLLVDPIRHLVEAYSRRFFLRKRFDPQLRDRLAHVLDLEEMGTIVMDALGRSRRVTTAGLYLRDPDGAFFESAATAGPGAPRRIEAATAHALLERLASEPLSLEQVERDVLERRRGRDTSDMAAEAVLAAAAVLGDLKRGVVVGIYDEPRASADAQVRTLIGILAVSDERSRDVFSPDDVAGLAELAGQIHVVIQNSRVYEQMKVRDRLAVLGQMSVGLAHEIRNPLGAIKGAAQVLKRPGGAADPGRLLDIIIAEVDRLNGVVGSVFELAPNSSATGPIDANVVVRRALQVLSAEPGNSKLEIVENLEPELRRVEIDPGQLEQILMNLLQNAAQAMNGAGRITVTTRLRFGWETRADQADSDKPLVELAVADNGPGLPRKVLDKLFMPFFTTKEKGVGLGLAISQSLAQAANGRIDVRSYVGKGTTFAVILPASSRATPNPPPVEPVP